MDCSREDESWREKGVYIYDVARDGPGPVKKNVTNMKRID